MVVKGILQWGLAMVDGIDYSAGEVGEGSGFAIWTWGE